MKRGSIWLIFALFLFLCGCIEKKDVETCPEYFESVIHVVETSHEAIRETLYFTMDEWWEKSMGTGVYKDEKYTCYIDEKAYIFDMKAIALDEKQWWETAGIFQHSGEDRIYICLYDANITYVEETATTLQLILIDCAVDDPQDYQITPYSVEPSYLFNWVNNCYRIGDYIYIAGQEELGAINLQTKQLYCCRNEYLYLEEYAQEKYGEKPYHIYHFNATLEQEDVIVYSAAVSQANDISPIGVVCIACKDGKPIAYMSINLATDEIKENVDIEVL